MQIARKQKGAVLVVSLLMLVVMTMLALWSINSSSVNLLIVNNMQSQIQAEAAAQQAIEEVISSISSFEVPAVQTVTVDGLGVAVSAAQCISRTPAAGYSATWSLVPEDTGWELTASVADTVTGAAAAITQGLRIRLTNGTCTL